MAVNNRKLAAALVLATLLMVVLASFGYVYGYTESELATIQGIVYVFKPLDEQELVPFAGAKVLANNTVTFRAKTTLTQQDGSYELQLESGSYSLMIAWTTSSGKNLLTPGYAITVTAGTITTGLNFYLDEEQEQLAQMRRANEQTTVLAAVIALLLVAVVYISKRKTGDQQQVE